MKRGRNEGEQQYGSETDGLLGFHAVQYNVYVSTFRRKVLPPSSGWLCSIDVDAYAKWCKIQEDYHMRNTQHENLKAHIKIDLFLTYKLNLYGLFLI